MGVLVRVKLAKPWETHPAGAVVEVDAQRAKTLREQGYTRGGGSVTFEARLVSAK